MSLRGNFTTLPVADLLGIIERGRKSGVLRCDSGSNVRQIFFEDGRIVSAQSNCPTEMLGQFLVARGLLSEEQLRQGLEVQEERGGALGALLVDLGILDTSQLREALTENTEEIVYGVFEWTEADFEFFPIAEEIPVRLSLRVADVLLEGTVRFDELSNIRRVLPDENVVLRATEKPPPQEFLKDPLCARVLDLVDGQRTMKEIRLELHATENAVGTRLLRLHEAGSLEVASEATGQAISRAAVDDCRQAAESLLRAGRAQEARELLREALDREPKMAGLHDLFEEADRRFVEASYAGPLPPAGVLEVSITANALLNSGLNSEEYFLLSRINGAWDVKAIVKVSPLTEGDTVSLLRRLLELGAVQLARLDGVQPS